MSKTGGALALARQLASAAPQRVATATAAASGGGNQNQQQGGGGGGSSSSSELAALRSAAAVTYEIPAALKDVPRHLFECVSIDKLSQQRPYLEFPVWSAMPSKELAPHVRFEISRPDPSDTSRTMKMPPFSLGKFPFFLIGSSKTICDMTLEHPSVSRVHLAVVHHQKGVVCICDMNSQNGVFLNGKRLEPGQYVPMQENDSLRIGGSSRTFTLKTSPKDPVPTSQQKQQQQQTTTASAATSMTAQRRSRSPEKNQQTQAQKEAEEKAKLQAQQQEEEEEEKEEQQRKEEQEQKEKEEVEEEAARKQKEEEDLVFEKVKLAHLLIKHKDVDKAVSRAPRNKGEKITRSNEDAKSLATAIHDQLLSTENLQEEENEEEGEESQQKREAKRRRFILKDKSIFDLAVSTHSECASAKNAGDMGVIEKGSLPNLLEFEDIALRLKPLQVSDGVVETHLGFHILFRSPDEE